MWWAPANAFLAQLGPNKGVRRAFVDGNSKPRPALIGCNEHGIAFTKLFIRPKTNQRLDDKNFGICAPRHTLCLAYGRSTGHKKASTASARTGGGGTHTALLNNMKEIDQLQLMFPRHAVDLIGFWNMADKANEQCSHDMALSSNDGTHYPLPVNEEKGRQLILLIQERCSFIHLDFIL